MIKRMKPVPVDVFFEINCLGFLSLPPEDLEEGRESRKIKELDNEPEELYWKQPTWEGEEIRHGKDEEDEDEDDYS